MKKILAVIFPVLLPAVAFSGTIKIGLAEALKNKSIQLQASSISGGYQGKTTRLVITNNTKSVLQITVDLGIILEPEDSVSQPMVLAGEEMLAVLPHAQGEVAVQTFCGNGPKMCPSRDLKFTFSRVGSDTLVQVLRFIKTNGLYDFVGQHAVWAITNNHALSSVYDPDRDAMSKKLIDLLVAVTGRPKPDYYTLVANEQTPNAPAYVPKVLKIYAQFEIRLDAPKVLTLGIYDQDGNMAQPVFENKQFGQQGHRFDVEFEAENVPAGKYYIRLKEGDAVLQEKMVNVE